jgi:N-acetylmuramic acid 6-phosphate (MurNAc-6-P) etherase
MTAAADATLDATTRALIDHLLRHAVRRGDFVLGLTASGRTP